MDALKIVGMYLCPHSLPGISFIHPAHGPNTYGNVMTSISKAGLMQPTFAQKMHLVYAAQQNPEEKYPADFLDLTKNTIYWASNGLLYVPKVGVYIQDRPSIEKNRVSMNKNDLVKKLESKDSGIRFVPFGFKTGELFPSDLAKHPLVLALANGEENAEIVARVAEKFIIKRGHTPRLYSLESVDEPTLRVASLGWDFGGTSFLLGGLGDISPYGRAFGVQEIKGSAQKS
ncbi:hypothetical protein KW805_02065 [Candidatus Pacearchaeota archaeon]|nr:hypothetical protein [Candidatus Pacearchaeota archaeon]